MKKLFFPFISLMVVNCGCQEFQFDYEETESEEIKAVNKIKADSILCGVRLARMAGRWLSGLIFH